MCAKSLHSCLALCDPWTPPGSSVHGILQARILEWVAISSSRGLFLTQGLNPHILVSCTGKQVLYTSATWEPLIILPTSPLPRPRPKDHDILRGGDNVSFTVVSRARRAPGPGSHSGPPCTGGQTPYQPWGPWRRWGREERERRRLRTPAQEWGGCWPLGGAGPLHGVWVQPLRAGEAGTWGGGEGCACPVVLETPEQTGCFLSAHFTGRSENKTVL